MNTAPSSAATNASALKWSSPSASEVPTSTGAIAAGSVRTRAAITQMRTALGECTASDGGPRRVRGEEVVIMFDLRPHRRPAGCARSCPPRKA